MNPLFVPPVVIGILIWLLGGNGSLISGILSLAVLFYSLIPFTGAVYLLHSKRISSLDLPDRESRQLLYSLTVASAAAASVCFFLIMPPEYQLITIISLVFLGNILIGCTINGKWKISVHTAALSTAGAIFLYFVLSGSIFSGSSVQILSLTVLLLLLLVMMWARYRLNIHTLAELFGGAASGFLLTLLQLTILIHLW